MAELGILLDGIAFRELDGRIYTALVPFGGAARTPLPRWLLPIVSRTSTTLRQRLAAAHAADVSDWSGAVVEEWNERAEDDLLERGRAYLVGDSPRSTGSRSQPGSTSSSVSSRRGSRGTSGSTRPASTPSASSVWSDPGPRLAGGGPDGRLHGLSATTTGPAAAQEELAALVREDGAADALLAATTLADVAQLSPTVAADLARYQDVWGQRAVRYEIACPTVVERPDWLLHQLQEAVRTPRARDDLAAAAEATRLRPRPA